MEQCSISHSFHISFISSSKYCRILKSMRNFFHYTAAGSPLLSLLPPPLLERRERNRYDIRQEIQCIYPESPEESFAGIIKNLSHSGMCLYLLNPVRIGQEVLLKSRQHLSKEGIVVWCRETGETLGIYKVGLKFT